MKSNHINNFLLEQSVLMNKAFEKFDEIRSKDGISVYRVYSNGNSYILKCFEKQDDTREIMNYKVLSDLNIPTMEVIASSDNAILLEDIGNSKVWRMGKESDLQNEFAGRSIAKWYKALHEKGRKYVRSFNGSLYSETDFFTPENINRIKLKTGTEGNPVWQLVEDNFSLIRSSVDKIEHTLTYNDFYYTNMIVANDYSEALMFDYNLLGKGYAYSDIRNVTSSLANAAKEVFLQEYGAFNQAEVIVDDVISPIVTLNFACDKIVFPNWGYSELEKVENGSLQKAVERLIMERNISKYMIRRIDSSDIAFLYKLMNKPEVINAIHINETSPSFWEKAFVEGQRDKDEENYIIFADGIKAGWLKLNGLSGSSVWLSMLVIGTEFQHIGIGSFAVQYSEKIATEKGYKKLSIHTTEDNLRAQKCYEKCGYVKTEYGSCTTVDGVQRMGYIYEKELV